MRNRFMMAVSALAVVPTLALAQQPAPRPASPPAQQPAPRPASPPPAMAQARPSLGVDRSSAWEITIGPALFGIDAKVRDALDNGGGDPFDAGAGRFMFGGHLRLGKQLGSHLGVSLGAGFGTGSGATVIVPTVDLTYTSNINSNFNFFIPVGVNVSKIADGYTSTIGLHAGLGFRSMIGEKMALRVEGRMARESYDELPDAGYNAFASAGLSFFMGGGVPRDTDADGVSDRRDRCANTPRGATVDATGCHRDTDRDGVADGIDRCASTPANTPVDATGCPRDTDRDGIADNLDRCPNTATGTPVDANGCPRDADGDGTADNADRCPNTPRGTPVDANGCPRDADADGTPDNMDRCPNTPAGTAVDTNGCPRDADGDGVADNADRCPNTPAGMQVGADGCPTIRDADRDNIADERDRCPNTPAGRNVDANGCPLAELPQVGQALVIRNVSFTSGTARLTPASRTVVAGIAQSIQATLRTAPSARFEVGGHTDNRGAVATNRRLSQQRAQAVMQALVAAGVPASALTAVGYGPDAPVGPNTTAVGRAQNRRVEIKRLS